MLRLVEPSSGLRAAWLEAHREWGDGQHEDGFGIRPTDELESTTGFDAWLERLELDSGPAAHGAHRCIYRWIMSDDSVVGGIALRYGTSDYVRTSGHIGYGIRPSARGRGIATWALGEILQLARDQGLERVLLVCESDNAASAATIVRNGGRSDDGAEDGMSRYWIELHDPT